MCELIGRKAEKALLSEWIHSKESEFIAVYGRRRVGKTFLVRKVVGEEMTFYISGMDNATMENQLLNFTLSLRKAASDETLSVPKNWLLAFDLLECFLDKLPKGKKTLFFDEMPWMDTPRSGFLPALERFWNTWASARKDVNLIACGSATSWMLNKLINNRGGLHNRLTHKILLQPFTLSETEAYLKKTEMQILP
ncbi:MAG TPA: ATP-binding protein [Paludibacteraceae bacterium]|nr:ATP-binding protein [Paludibacteraceae bacterium]